MRSREKLNSIELRNSSRICKDSLMHHQNILSFLRNFQELNQREQEGQLDEGFLSEVSAQLRQVSANSLIIWLSCEILKWIVCASCYGNPTLLTLLFDRSISCLLLLYSVCVSLGAKTFVFCSVLIVLDPVFCFWECKTSLIKSVSQMSVFQFRDQFLSLQISSWLSALPSQSYSQSFKDIDSAYMDIWQSMGSVYLGGRSWERHHFMGSIACEDKTRKISAQLLELVTYLRPIAGQRRWGQARA